MIKLKEKTINWKKKITNIIKKNPYKEEEEKAKPKPKTNNRTKKSETKRKRRNLEILNTYLRKAGYETIEPREFTKIINIITITISTILTILLIIASITFKTLITRFIILLISIWTIIFLLILGIIWIIIYVFLDLKIYSRTKELEDVLPDFLQLTSANISAGMPIDQAMWYAVRPRFGVLAREIEEVAKSTIAGEDLEEALKEFTKKYDSLILKRSINLIVEGMRAGGQLAELLSRIALDIQETKLMKKEIGASIATYVIFITFATIVAAPFLFALSSQLLQIVQSIMGTIDFSSMSTGSFNFGASGESLSIKNFRIFSALALIVSSTFSAAIVSTIQKGKVKDGLKYIPIFIIVSLLLFLLGNYAVGGMMKGFV